MTNERDCKHGQLARSCYICELEKERDALAAKLAELGKQEPVFIEPPIYNHGAMGCGLEDRGITDRYEAMLHGWECAIESVLSQLPDGPLYLAAGAKPDDVKDAERSYKAQVFDVLTRLGMSEKYPTWQAILAIGTETITEPSAIRAAFEADAAIAQGAKK